MSESSTRRRLSPHLRARMTEQREAIEAVSGDALQQLNGNLRAVATHEQSITESAMVKHHAALRRGLVGISKMVLLCYLALFVALILGLVGIGLVWEWRIESYQEELATVRANIADQQAFVREIEKKSGGVRYRDSSERLYLLMPRGSRAYYNLEEGWVVELPKK